MEKTVIQHIEESKQTLFSFELLPPLKGHDFESTQQAIDPLLEFNPSFINITYHLNTFGVSVGRGYNNQSFV